MITGRVLITGGTGSLGTAIIERAHKEKWDAQLIVYSRDEVKQAQLAERFPDVRFYLGDVQDPQALRRAMRDVELVIHTAAYKRVPEAEREPVACARANVDGSINVATEAIAAGVQKVVAISTDKACSPINAYGQSKALMERVWQGFARADQPTSFHLVRYGNVLASRGSVVPALMAKVAKGEPITLTDPTMSRFWLTLGDAVELVLASMELEPGSILIPRCPASTMAVMAEAIAPGHPVEVVGSRGGEKVHEQLLNNVESPYASKVPLGWALRSLAGQPVGELEEGFSYTSSDAKQLSPKRLRSVISAITEGRPAQTL